jgi:hypothetical protein
MELDQYYLQSNWRGELLLWFYLEKKVIHQ